MATFVVHIATDPNNYAVDRIDSEYPGEFHYKLKDDLYLLISKNGTAGSIAQQLGLGEQPQVSGVVLKMNKFFAGYASRNLWDWLDTATSS